MITLPNLELHITHVCNLSCESCSHYSNQGHRGLLTLQDADAWMQPWMSRLRPRVFTLLGGEPTLHPRLSDFLVAARKTWPLSDLHLITNGFFLYRHPHLPAILKATNTLLSVSLHHDGPDYRAKLLPNLQILNSWVQQEGVRATFTRSYGNWTRRYQGQGSSMEPFTDGRPWESWQHCPARFATQLFEGKLWKCAPIAYLKMQHAKYRLSESWTPYLRYEPLAPDCSEAALDAFFRRREESCCGMCPANPEKFTMPSPLPQRASSRSSEPGES